MANKPAEINQEELKKLMHLRPSLEDTATWFDVSTRTIERFIRAEFDMTFKDFREKYMARTRLSLVKRALDRSKKSDTMLIFCLKNLCDWTNEPKGALGEALKAFTLAYRVDE